MMKNRVVYSDDVSILEHANFVVYRSFDGHLEAFFILRLEDTEQCFVYTCELYQKVSDSWLNEDDLPSFNSFCGSNYPFDTLLTFNEQFELTRDLCIYYGVSNFDSYPHEMHLNNLESFLKGFELI